VVGLTVDGSPMRLPASKIILADRKTSTVVHDDPQAAVVETVVRTLWAAVELVGRGGTPWDDWSWLGGMPQDRWKVWDGFHSPHNPEVDRLGGDLRFGAPFLLIRWPQL
jgi:hypothetical protein